MKFLFWSMAGVVALVLVDADRERQAQLAEPGPQHKQLNAFVGTWQVAGKCFEENKDGESVSGNVTSDWILGNRFVRCNAKFTEAGKMIEGIGMTGYDNALRKYVSTWQDTKCTGIKMETGDYDPGSNTFTFTGEFKDENGQMVRCRKVIKVNSNSQHTMTAYLTEPGESEAKIAELTFNRSGG